MRYGEKENEGAHKFEFGSSGHGELYTETWPCNVSSPTLCPTCPDQRSFRLTGPHELLARQCRPAKDSPAVPMPALPRVTPAVESIVIGL